MILSETGRALQFASGLDASYGLPDGGRQWRSSLLDNRRNELGRLGELVKNDTFDSIAAFVELYGRLARTSAQTALPAQILGR